MPIKNIPPESQELINVVSDGGNHSKEASEMVVFNGLSYLIDKDKKVVFTYQEHSE